MSLPILFRVADRLTTRLSIRKHRELSRGMMQAAGEHWHQTMLPRHFRSDASRRYGYAPRKPRTKMIKIALARRGKVIEGGTTPLVWSGLMRDKLMGHRTLAVFPSRVRVRMFGPRYMTMKVFTDRTERFDALQKRGITPNFDRFSRTGIQPDKRKEVIATIDAEKQDLAGVIKRYYVTKLKSLRDTKTTTIRR